MKQSIRYSETIKMCLHFYEKKRWILFSCKDAQLDWVCYIIFDIRFGCFSCKRCGEYGTNAMKTFNFACILFVSFALLPKEEIVTLYSI